MTKDLVRADYLLEMGRAKEAERIARAVLAEHPESTDALRTLVRALLQGDSPRNAISFARQAVAHEPDNEHGHRLLALALSDEERHLEAVRPAREAVRLAPQTWETHHVLGSVLRAGVPPVPRARLEAAVVAAKEAIRLAPHEASPHNLAGLCFSDLSDPTRAAAAYTEALRLDPANATAMNNLAVLRLDRGKLREGTRHLVSALGSAPQDTTLHENYDALVFRLITRLCLALVGLGIVLLAMAMSPSPYLVRACTASLFLVVYAVGARSVTRHLPEGPHRWMRGVLRRTDKNQRVLLIAFVALIGAVLAIGYGTRDTAEATVGLVLLAVYAVGVYIIGRGIWRSVTGGRWQARPSPRRPPH